MAFLEMTDFWIGVACGVIPGAIFGLFIGGWLMARKLYAIVVEHLHSSW